MHRSHWHGGLPKGIQLSRKPKLPVILTSSVLTRCSKSKTPSRIKANLQGDFILDAEDVAKVDALDKKLRFNDPSESFGWEFYADLDGKQ